MGFPQFFTPNNDEFNDTWTIKALSEQNQAELYIYDRYGKLLKKLIATKNSWDGTYNGNAMPANDYWFILNYIDQKTGKPQSFKANFTLKR